MNRFFALVANNHLDVSFINRMSAALDRYGKTILTSEKEISQVPEKFAMVIVDSDDVNNAPGLVKNLRQSLPGMPIVVFMLYHNLEMAREVFKMGASDCLVKGLDEESFLAQFKNKRPRIDR